MSDGSRSLDPASVVKHVLPNGLTLLVRRDASAPVVAIVTYVKAGYFDETDDVVGIAHVLEHMFFKGTAQRGVGDIARETKAKGGYLNASTIYDHTSYYTVLPSSSFDAGLEIQCDAYANSAIDAEELARELEVIIQEAKRKADNPPALATETLYEMLHDRHRMRRWRIGREDGLRALTRDAMMRFYRNFYRPSSTILAIVGDVDSEHVVREVERCYGALTDAPIERASGPGEPAHDDFRYRELSGDVAQSQLLFGWRTPETLHPDSPVLDVAATILGSGRASRLYRAVRERQLASSVSAYDYTPTELGVFVVHAECPPDTVAGAARSIWEQVRQLRERVPVGREMERAQRFMESRWIRRFETMEGQANFLAEWEALGDWRLADGYIDRIVSATGTQVRDVARRYLDAGRAGCVVYRPQTASVVAKDAERFQELLDARKPDPLLPLPPAVAVPSSRSATVTLERTEGGIDVYHSEQGLPILVRRKAGAAIVHLGVFASGGAALEGAERAGVSMLLARTAIKGTERRAAARIAEESELLGGSVSGAAGGEAIGWTISVPTKHAAAALDLLADVALGPTLKPDALETERAVALSDVAMLRDDMFRYPMRLATEAAFGAHPYGISSLGSPESLEAITTRDLKAWHKRAFIDAPAVVGVVGDVDPALIAGWCAAAFGALGTGRSSPIPRPEWPSTVVQRTESRDKAQTAIAIAFPAPSRRDPERYVAHLVAGVASGLGGRFFDELRDKQSLAYTVHAFSSERPLAGSFFAYIATSPEKEEIARRGLLAEFAKLRDTGISEDELERAKQYALGTHAIRQQSGGAVMGDMIDAWLVGTGLGELEEFGTRVRAVTTDQARRVSLKYFDEARHVEGIVRGVAGKSV